jgi:hypothetical protein
LSPSQAYLAQHLIHFLREAAHQGKGGHPEDVSRIPIEQRRHASPTLGEAGLLSIATTWRALGRLAFRLLSLPCHGCGILLLPFFRHTSLLPVRRMLDE